MKKKEKFIKILDLSVSEVLLSFVNKELLPGTNISRDRFWRGLTRLFIIYLLKTKSSLKSEKKCKSQ